MNPPAMHFILPCLFFWATVATPGPSPMALPECQSYCGDIEIPYPYGIRDGTNDNCSLPGFDITCDTSSLPHKPYLGKGDIEVLNITLLDGTLKINQTIAKNCHYTSGNWSYVEPAGMRFEGRPYKLSDQNRFVAIGCDTRGYMMNYGYDQSGETVKFSTGCSSTCSDINIVQNNACSGIGCCEVEIPKDLQNFHIRLDSYFNHTNCQKFSPCSFAFVADTTYPAEFTTSSYMDFIDRDEYPVTLEWSMGNTKEDNTSCKHLEKSAACRDENSYCYNATNVSGYRCNCSAGFIGNPYLVNGCADIDECQQSPNVCVPHAKCYNTPGNYTCACPKIMNGDGRIDGTRCSCPWWLRDDGSGGCSTIPFIVILGTGFTILFILISITWMYLVRKKSRLLELRVKFFRDNGGDILGRMNKGATKIYSAEDLCKATDNYNEDCVLGKGAYGTVYKGELDGLVVAVKKSKIADDENQKKQFISEVVSLSRIKQDNIVKLLGCCLETKVPMLVYEFVPNGNLSEHIHSEGSRRSLSWYKRRKIATDIAKALAYLHSKDIIHRDIKSTNILLDDSYTAKVADFGTSRIIPFDQDYLQSLLQGTFGYLDPECFQSGQFTDKSDVYSFGVVLIELLTGKKALFNHTSLASYFISCLNNNNIEVFEEHILEEEPQENIMVIAELAIRCIQVKREDRPSMREVYKELDISSSGKDASIEKNDEESMPLMMKTLNYSSYSATENTTSTEGESWETPMITFDSIRLR